MFPDRYLSTAAVCARTAFITIGLLVSLGCSAEDAFEVVTFPTTDGGSIEARLIAEGLGEAWRQDGAYRDELVALEEEVQTLAVGCLWGG